MAYADHSEASSRTISIVIVALIHVVLGYAFVTGLGMKYVKKAAEQLNVIDVKEEPPPPDVSQATAAQAGGCAAATRRCAAADGADPRLPPHRIQTVSAPRRRLLS